MLFPLAISLLLGAVGIGITAFLVAKLFGEYKAMGVAIGLAAMYGFPTSYILAQEVSRARGATPKEREALFAYILPKVLVAGFITVTIASVIIAGVLVRFI